MTMLLGFTFKGLPSISISMSDNVYAPRDKQIHHKNISTYRPPAKPPLHQKHKSYVLQYFLPHDVNSQCLPKCRYHSQCVAPNDIPTPCLHDKAYIARRILPYKI